MKKYIIKFLDYLVKASVFVGIVCLFILPHPFIFSNSALSDPAKAGLSISAMILQAALVLTVFDALFLKDEELTELTDDLSHQLNRPSDPQGFLDQ